MSPDAQRVAIAEVCGWQKIQRPLSDQEGEIPGHFEIRWYHPKIHTSIYPLYALPKEPPAYLTDLNAMHEAEKVLTEAQQKDYAHRLHPTPRRPYEFLSDDFDMLHATAAQRAEAFLRCLGKWKE